MIYDGLYTPLHWSFPREAPKAKKPAEDPTVITLPGSRSCRRLNGTIIDPEIQVEVSFLSGYARAWFARGTEINLVTKMGRGYHRI